MPVSRSQSCLISQPILISSIKYVLILHIWTLLKYLCRLCYVGEKSLTSSLSRSTWRRMGPVAFFSMEYACEACSRWYFCCPTARYCISSLSMEIAVTSSPIWTLPVLSIPPECPTLVESLATTNSVTKQLVYILHLFLKYRGLVSRAEIFLGCL